MTEGVGNAPSVSTQPQRLAPILFGDRCSQLILPSTSGQDDRSCTCDLLVPNWWLRANARLLMTLHPAKWLPDLDSHQDKRLNRPPCYFHTIWQWRCRQD